MVTGTAMGSVTVKVTDWVKAKDLVRATDSPLQRPRFSIARRRLAIAHNTSNQLARSAAQWPA